MAYDESLAERIRDHLLSNPDVSEKKMFGGLAFLLDGKMAVGVSGDSLMLRVGSDRYESLLGEPGVEEFAKTGRPMKGWVLVYPARFENDDELGEWVDIGVSVAESIGK